MLTEILDGLVKLLGPIATLSKERRELKDTALRSISNALDETYLYYRDLENSTIIRNNDREGLLSKYWSAAAISLRHFDPELAAMQYVIINQSIGLILIIMMKPEFRN